jgi:hypothetical protein
MIKNLEAFKELLAHYKSLTLTELQYQWQKLEEDCDFDYVADGGDVMGGITGFGTTGSCTLCQACKCVCEECVHSLSSYGIDYPCIDTSYLKMNDATCPEDLYEAIQYRIEYMEGLLNLLQ